MLKAVLAALLILWPPWGGVAYAEPANRDYEQVIERAVAEFGAGNWDEARALFRRAHEIDPNARTLRGLGITAFELRRYVDAIEELQGALSDARKPLTDKQRVELEVLLLRARAFVAVYPLILRPAGAGVRVDGQPAALRAGELLLDPGSHMLEIQAPGHTTKYLELRADAGRHEPLSVVLTSEPSPRAPTSGQAARTLPGQTQPSPSKYVATWTLAAVGVLALPGAVVSGALARHEAQRFHACTGSHAHCDPIRTVGQREQLATNVLFGVAGAGALSAVLAYLIEHRHARRAAHLSASTDGRSLFVHAALSF